MKGHAAKKGKQWYAVVDEVDANGKRRRRWHSGFRTKKDAEAGAVEILGRQQKGEYVAPTKDTLGHYMRGWLDGRKAALRPSTWHGYDKNLRVHIEPRLGGVKVQQLTRERLGRFYAELQADRGLGPRSVRHVHTLIRRALRDLVDDHVLARNPADRVELPKVGAGPMRVWSAGELRAFLEHVEADRLAALWRLAGVTGMRRGELCGLKWKYVRVDTAELSVEETLLDVKNELVNGEPKTARGHRTIPLDAGTVALLRWHQTAQKAERLAFGPGFNDDGYVFVDEAGEPVRPAWLTRAFTQRAKAAGLPAIRLHDLRHTSASLAVASGVPITVVSERLGHAKTSITLDVYAHAQPAQHREAADKLADVVFGNG